MMTAILKSNFKKPTWIIAINRYYMLVLVLLGKLGFIRSELCFYKYFYLNENKHLIQRII